MRAACRRFRRFGLTHIGPPRVLVVWLVFDDEGVSFTVSGGVSGFRTWGVGRERDAAGTLRVCRWMCAGPICQGRGDAAFQLESLILAQNERWRQA